MKRSIRILTCGLFIFVASLAAYGQDLNTKLHNAAKAGRTAEVSALLRQGADPNAWVFGETPLIVAVMGKHADTARALLDGGADVNAKDQSGETPLLRAATHGNAGIVRLLLDRGADITATTNAGETALTLAGYYRDRGIIAVLKSRGAQEAATQASAAQPSPASTPATPPAPSATPSGTAPATPPAQSAPPSGNQPSQPSKPTQSTAQPSMDELSDRAMAAFDKGDYDAAILALTDAIRLNPHWALFTLRGTSYFKKGDYERAVKDFDEAVRLNPDSTRFMLRGAVERKKGDFDRAIQDFTEALRLKPSDAQAFLERARAYKDKGDYERALTDLNQATAHAPSLEFQQEVNRELGDLNQKVQEKLHGSAPFQRGEAAYKNHDYAGAIAAYTEAIRLKPGDISAFIGRADSEKATEDYKSAISDYTEAIRLTSLPMLKTWTMRKRGDASMLGCQLLLHEYCESAIRDFNEWLALPAKQRALDAGGRDADVYYMRGAAKKFMGDNAGGDADIAQAKQLDPTLK
ncbi:MAG TPA: tetratricopeptide repeat protein [Candidatus Acidoferrales bacterium]|nr:tetratricopeptide repeat protein [Candidatus Acidoferrales bacterium]